MGRMILLAVIAAGVSRAAEPKLTAKAEPSAPPAAVAGPVRELLDPTAVVVRGADGGVVLRLWFRKDIPVRATADQVKNGLTYREIPVTTVLGVVEFPAAFVDSRKQELPAGAYTLRFALQPETGDHLGTAPQPDFGLLCPAAKDVRPDLIEAKALYEMSAAATGGAHPAVMMLYPERKADAAPKVVGKGASIVVVCVARPVATDDGPATLPFAVTVAGHAKE